MFLNETDLEKFDKDGYLFFPKLFNSDEAALLKDCLLYTSPSPRD